MCFHYCALHKTKTTFIFIKLHFRNTLSAWSSGTGGAGFIGSIAYAGLTDPNIFNLKPRNALLFMLTIPFLFAVT